MNKLLELKSEFIKGQYEYTENHLYGNTFSEQSETEIKKTV